jgi:hypothetical protein
MTSGLVHTALLQAWWPKLRPGGIMAGHDYNSARQVGHALLGV